MAIDVTQEYEPYTRVTLVVDPEFGERAKTLAEIGPLWIIDSPKNRAVVEELWAAERSRFVNAPTCFNACPGRSAEESTLNAIDTVDEHHPHWRIFEVIGVPLTQKLLEALLECAPGSAQVTGTGFIFSRQ